MISIDSGLLALIFILGWVLAMVWVLSRAQERNVARKIAADLREEFPPSDIPDYIEVEFGGRRDW